MKTRKHKQWGGSNTKYSPTDKGNLASVGFTRNQIQFLDHVKQTYGLANLNADGIVYLIKENADEELNPTSYTAFYKNTYPDDTFTDNEEDTDDEFYGGRKKRKSRKQRSRFSTKRETKRKSIKRRHVARKSRRRRRA
jgi:hypothetical protein